MTPRGHSYDSLQGRAVLQGAGFGLACGCRGVPLAIQTLRAGAPPGV